LGPLLFLFYINDLSLALNKISTPILFADDVSVIVSKLDPFIFRGRLNEVFKTLSIGFKVSLLSLNFSKRDYITFTVKKFYQNDTCIKIAYVNKEISD
jgi:hypothetical protein